MALLLASCASHPSGVSPLMPQAAAPLPQRMVRLEWDYGSDPVSFRIYRGWRSGQYDTRYEAGTNRFLEVPASRRWDMFFVATAFRNDLESTYSNEAVLTNGALRPPPKTNLVLAVSGRITAYADPGQWVWRATNLSQLVITNPAGPGRLWRGTNLTWESWRY